MKMLIDYSPNNREVIPLSVNARNSKADVFFGQELVYKFLSKEPMPTLFESSLNADRTTKKLRRITTYMTAFRPKRRKTVEEVQEEISELLEDIEENEFPSLQNNPPGADNTAV